MKIKTQIFTILGTTVLFTIFYILNSPYRMARIEQWFS